MRDELFIHSEMPPARRQACRGRYQENQCWDGEQDYQPAGCIKLKPKDITTATALARAVSSPAKPATATLLLVTN